MKKYLKSIAIISTMLFTMTACINDLNVKPIDPNIKQVFSQDEVFYKIYSTLGQTGQKGPDGDCDIVADNEGYSSFYRVMWVLNEFPTDEGYWIWADARIPDLLTMSWNSSNSFIMLLYNRLNFDITLCNHFLDNTEGITDEKTIKQRAEVRFIRALHYFHMLDLFGNVPFTTTVSLTNPEQIQRADLFDWLEKELKAIEPDLFDVGTKTGYYRADKAAVWLLLSRLYLNAEVYAGTAKWTEAAEYAAKVMTSSYTLSPSYQELFMGDNDNLSTVNRASREIILPIAQDGIQIQSWGGSRFLVNMFRDAGMLPSGSADSWSCYRSSPELIYKFFANPISIKADEKAMPGLANDDRAIFCSKVIKKAADGVTDTISYETSFKGTQGSGSGFNNCWAICKWTNIYASGEPGSDPNWTDTDIPLFRASEAYLTYAEAVLNGAPATNGSALEVVNNLRARSNAAALPALDKATLLDEWCREFYCEGRRRIDLIRFGKFAGPTADYNWEGRGGKNSGDAAANIDAIYNLYPLPISDLIANPNLKQNEGY